ncbi:EamA family transporter [Telmatospirillum sp.]|uniref:DMT family transporter n=1 Tax=Telmatospirillum sp. TaxID=2079197 RepID=UPI0028429560|nr:EamA family transporter [Telmatospirillum sp.]MDR3435327.1 EamA family transporter [Telmatospirillum sp.]
MPAIGTSARSTFTPFDAAAGLLAVVVWGFNYVAVKAGTHEFPPLLLTGLRFLLVAALLVPFYRLPRRQWRLIVLLSSLMGTMHFGMFFASMAGLDVPTGAIVGQLAVPFSAVVAAVFYGERLGLQGLFGMFVSFAGVLLVVGEPQHADPVSLVLSGLSSVAWALSMVVIKKIGPINPLALNGWMAAFAVPQLFLLSWCLEQGQMHSFANAGWKGWGAVGYTGILATIVAYSLWYRLLARYPINRVVPLNLLNPVIAVVAGVALFGDSLSWAKVIGGTATLVGVAVLQFRRSPC